MSCPYKKGVVVMKAGQHWGACDAKPSLIRKEMELKEVAHEEWVLKRQRLHIEEGFEWAKVCAQGFEASWRDRFHPHPSTEFLKRLKTAVTEELETPYNG